MTNSSPGSGPLTASNIAVVDAGAFVAAVDTADRNHLAVAEVLARRELRFVAAALCVAEATYLIHQKYGPVTEADFLEGLGGMDVLAPEPAEWPRIAALVRQYASLRLGGADASLIVLAERLDTDLVLTLDRRHFAAVRPAHCSALRLLPETLR